MSAMEKHRLINGCSSFRSYLKTLIIYILCVELVNCEEKTNIQADFYNKTVISRIAFGSCNNQNKIQPLWKKILQQSPEVWIWLGDAVYADTNIAPLMWTPAPLELVAERYQKQKKSLEYQSFLKSGIRVLGVWDDHDYGMDRGGKNHKDRLQTQGIFLDFLDEPLESLRRHREGVYGSYLFGEGDKTVKIILLDTRSHSIPKGSGCDILGETQWAWLEKQLSDKNPPSLTLIGSGIQILSDLPVIEKWKDCPESYDRLIWMLQKTPGVMLLSGDVHFGEFQCLNTTSTGYPLYEFTSSGMTSVCVSLTSKSFCNWLINDVALSSARFNDAITELNYGMISIDWNKTPHPELPSLYVFEAQVNLAPYIVWMSDLGSSVQVSIEIRGEKGAHIQHAIPLGHLTKQRDSPRCPIAARSPPFFTKTAFWITLFIVAFIVTCILLRIIISFTKFFALNILFPLLGIRIQNKSQVQIQPINGKVKNE